MNEWTAQLSLSDVQKEFCAWHIWRGVSGRLYARRPGAQRGEHATAEGDDPAGLRDAIIAAVWQTAARAGR